MAETITALESNYPPIENKTKKKKKKNLKVSIILNGEILSAFLLRSETRQRMSTLTILFNILLVVSAKAIRKEKEVNLSDWKRKK